MPCLKQLFGHHLQFQWIECGFDSPIHPLNIELLSNTQADCFLHSQSPNIDISIMQKGQKRIVSTETEAPLYVTTQTLDHEH